MCVCVHVHKNQGKFVGFFVCVCVCVSVCVSVVLPVLQLCDLQQGLAGRTALGYQGGGKCPLLLLLHHQLMPLLWAEPHGEPSTDRDRRIVKHHWHFQSSLLSPASQSWKSAVNLKGSSLNISSVPKHLAGSDLQWSTVCNVGNKNQIKTNSTKPHLCSIWYVYVLLLITAIGVYKQSVIQTTDKTSLWRGKSHAVVSEWCK